MRFTKIICHLFIKIISHFFHGFFDRKTIKFWKTNSDIFRKRQKKSQSKRPALKKYCSRICSRKRAVRNPVQIPEKRVYLILPDFHFFAATGALKPRPAMKLSFLKAGRLMDVIPNSPLRVLDHRVPDRMKCVPVIFGYVILLNADQAIIPKRICICAKGFLRQNVRAEFYDKMIQYAPLKIEIQIYYLFSFLH